MRFANEGADHDCEASCVFVGHGKRGEESLSSILHLPILQSGNPNTTTASPVRKPQIELPPAATATYCFPPTA